MTTEQGAITSAEEERIRLRKEKEEKLSPELAESMHNAKILSGVKTQLAKSAIPYDGGPILPWHSVPPKDGTRMMITFAVESPKLESLFVPASCVREEVVGHFCGSPIRTIDLLKVEVEAQRDLQVRLEHNKESEESYKTRVSSLLLPGQGVCSDGVIRRGTTSEAVGESFYAYEVPKGTVKVSIELATLEAIAGEMIYFRPDGKVGDGEFALRYEEAA